MDSKILNQKKESFGRLLEIMDRLRSECPWNKAQTIDTLRPLTIEEVYELSDAILKKSDNDIKKELGDVLLHVVFYSKIAEEEKKYSVNDVINCLCDKMVSRHPHVFSDKCKMDAAAVSDNWEMIKAREKGGNKRILSGVPDSLPPILKAYSMQDKARGVGFDWDKKEDVWSKVKEELGELQTEFSAMAKENGHADKSIGAPSEDSSEEFKSAYYRAEEELGDYLFSIINAARLYGLNPDTALNRTCDKFRRRFTYLEEQTIRKGEDLHNISLEKMNKIWDEDRKSVV